jgi:DNA-binding transcriptional ArsR family regulator
MPTSSRAGSNANRRLRQDAWECLHKVLGDLFSERREILCALARGPVRVSDVADELDLDVKSISHHLGLLFGLGLVEFSARGRDHVYRLSKLVRVERRREMICMRIETGHGGSMLLRVPDTAIDLSPRLSLPLAALSKPR